MTELREGASGRAVTARALSTGVLADRLAAALLHHEPGWRLPRITALARRYNVSAGEIDAALDELTARHLLSRLPDGQVYRASPAEYRVPIEGMPGLTSYVDPMGGELCCKSRNVSTRRPPEDIGWALGLEPGDPAIVVRCVWNVGGEPGGLSATYLPERLGEMLPEFEGPPFTMHPAGAAGRAGAFQVEMRPPPPAAARTLRLAAGVPVATVTVRFEDPSRHTPVALTVAMLRPDLFRIVVRAPDAEGAAAHERDFAGAWTDALEDWEP